MPLRRHSQARLTCMPLQQTSSIYASTFSGKLNFLGLSRVIDNGGGSELQRGAGGQLLRERLLRERLLATRRLHKRSVTHIAERAERHAL